MLKIGKPAPDFALPNQDGQTVKLSDFRGHKVIVFAFPKANTSGCNVQACGFRDTLPQIKTANAVVLGISTDTQADLKAWKVELDLPYDLLSDAEHQVLAAWGAWDDISFKARSFAAPVRSFWVIDEDGIVIAAQVRITPEASVKQALDVING